MKRTIAGYPNGARVEALIINDDKILTIHRKNHGQEYWVLPGGGWEERETAKDSVAREVWEETNLKVAVVKPVFFLYVENDGQKLVYLCKYLGGEPELGNFNEKKKMAEDPEQFYEPCWLPISDLVNYQLYTLEFRDWFLQHYKEGKLPDGCFEMKITPRQFRE